MKKRSKKRWLRKYDGKKYGWFLLARDSVLSLVIVFLIFNLLLGVSRVDGVSMEPTLSNGESVFFLRLFPSVRRGDVVFARMPSGSNYVKRVIALPGDTLDLRDGMLYINGEAESGGYWVGDTLPQDGIVTYPYTVPQGSYFLVGDNREGSVDSRSFGALPRSSLRGWLVLR